MVILSKLTFVLFAFNESQSRNVVLQPLDSILIFHRHIYKSGITRFSSSKEYFPFTIHQLTNIKKNPLGNSDKMPLSASAKRFAVFWQHELQVKISGFNF